MTPPPVPQHGEEFITDEELMEPQEKKSNTWQYVAIGGTVGLLMGVGGAYAATQMNGTEEEFPPATLASLCLPTTNLPTPIPMIAPQSILPPLLMTRCPTTLPMPQLSA